MMNEQNPLLPEPVLDERIPVHATEEELTELYEHTHYSLFPDIFAVLVVVASFVFIRHAYKHAHMHVLRKVATRREKSLKRRQRRHALQAQVTS